MGVVIRKSIGVIFYLVYYNLCLMVLAASIYSDAITLTIVILDMFVFALDALIRPAAEREEVTRATVIMALLFILHPFLITLLYFENQYLVAEYLVTWNNPIISVIGIVVYLVASLIILGSRVQLGRYGSGEIGIEEDHELMTEGLYKHIRHPLYSGGLIGKLATGLAFRSYVVTLLMLVGYFVTFRSRMELEEQILTSEFGQEYEAYMERTKRLIPYLY